MTCKMTLSLLTETQEGEEENQFSGEEKAHGRRFSANIRDSCKVSFYLMECRWTKAMKQNPDPKSLKDWIYSIFQSPPSPGSGGASFNYF